MWYLRLLAKHIQLQPGVLLGPVLPSCATPIHLARVCGLCCTTRRLSWLYSHQPVTCPWLLSHLALVLFPLLPPPSPLLPSSFSTPESLEIRHQSNIHVKYKCSRLDQSTIHVKHKCSWIRQDQYLAKDWRKKCNMTYRKRMSKLNQILPLNENVSSLQVF